MFVEHSGALGFKDWRWYLIYGVLIDEFSSQARRATWSSAHDPIALLAGWASREAIRKGVKDVC